MLRKGFKHGFSENQWSAAKEEARQAMIAVARSKNVIAYSDLVRKTRVAFSSRMGVTWLTCLAKSRRKRTKKAGECSLSW